MPAALVTGAHGFVGRPLCELLLARGWRVTAGHRGTVFAAIPGAIEESLPLTENVEHWQRALGSVDCVVHLAANVHRMRPVAGLDAEFEAVNVAGSRFVAEQAARAGVKRLVFLSSAKVNGEGSDEVCYRVEDAVHPQDAYARSKWAAELALADICARAGMQYVVIRPPLVYGPGVRANFLRLMQVADLGWPLPLRSIRNQRSLLGLANLTEFIRICMTHPLAAGRVWLVSDGEDLSTPELIRRLAALMHRPDRLFSFSPRLLKAAAALVGRGDEAARLCDSFRVDSRPARAILGWKPPLSVDDGLAQTVAAYRIGRGARGAKA